MNKQRICALLSFCLLFCFACGITSAVAEMTQEELLAILPGEWCDVSTVLQPMACERVSHTVVFSEDGSGNWKISVDSYSDSYAFSWELQPDLMVSAGMFGSYRFSTLCGYPIMTRANEATNAHVTLMKTEDLADFISTKVTKIAVNSGNLSEYISGPIAIGPCYQLFGEKSYCYGVCSPAYASGLVYLGREGECYRESNYNGTRVYAIGYGADAVPCANEKKTVDKAKYSFVKQSAGMAQNVGEVVFYFIDASCIESIEFVTEKTTMDAYVNDVLEQVELNSVLRHVTFVGGGELWYDFFTYRSEAPKGAKPIETELDFSACLF